MALLIDGLNEKQREAATTIDCPVRIVAGAGSGKTSVLIARIEYLIREADVYPNRIMAITFTNKAAREMQERLEAVLPFEAMRVRISTIHSLCARILREDAVAAGYPKNFTILDAEDQKSILRRIYKTLNVSATEFPPGKMLAMISDNKTHQLTPEQVREYASDFDSTTSAEVYTRYVKELQTIRAMDFDDLLLETKRLLETDEGVRNKWQNRLDYIHVDEFQDVDPIQYQLIRLLCRPDTALAVVGDPDQTIYTWRGASVDIIMNFEKDFPGAKTIILDLNYRSVQPILEAANELIACNKNRVKKDLRATREGSLPVIEYEGFTQPDEVRFITDMIGRLHDSTIGGRKIEWKDIALLYRANYLSRNFEKMFVSHKIPYNVVGGTRFFERREVKDVLAYLSLLQKPDENDPKFMALNVSVERVINVPRRGNGEKFLEKLRIESDLRGINMLDVLRDPQTVPKKKAAEFISLIDELKMLLERDGLEEIVAHILSRTGLEEELRRETAQNTKEQAESRVENVKELAEDIHEAQKKNPDLTLEDYLQDIALFTGKKEEITQNAVTMMTVHAAKGTEFPVVFVCGLNDGIFPSDRSLAESGRAGLEEERRLLYVAMTRAKDLLFLTWAQNLYAGGQALSTPSRFLLEISDDKYAQMRAAGKLPRMTEQEKNRKNEQEAKDNLSRLAKVRDQQLKAARTLRERAKHTKKPLKLRPGDRVGHTKFGLGTVKSADGSIIEVEFDAYGTKKIAQSFLSLADTPSGS